jgi:hypothetical protein
MSSPPSDFQGVHGGCHCSKDVSGKSFSRLMPPRLSSHNPPDDTQIRMVRALGFPSVLKQIINEET